MSEVLAQISVEASATVTPAAEVSPEHATVEQPVEADEPHLEEA